MVTSRSCFVAVTLAACFNVVVCSDAVAQLQQGTIHGIVLAPDGQPAAAGLVRLLDPLGVPLQTVPVRDGEFVRTNVAPGTYTLRADAPPLHALIQQLAVTTAVPVRVELRLSAAAAEQVTVHGRDAEPSPTTTRITLSGDAVRRAPSRLRSRGVQDAVAALAGWSTEDNGLLHVRGVLPGRVRHDHARLLRTLPAAAAAREPVACIVRAGLGIVAVPHGDGRRRRARAGEADGDRDRRRSAHRARAAPRHRILAPLDDPCGRSERLLRHDHPVSQFGGRG